MSTRARKDRKRAGIRFTKPQKTGPVEIGQAAGLGLVRMPDVVFDMIRRG
jgi:hypothetical protein